MRRASVAQHGALAAGQDRGEVGALARQAPVADRVHAAMQRVQPTHPHAPRHGAAIKAERPQLRERHDAPLHPSHLRQRPVAQVALCMDAMRNVSHASMVTADV